MKKLLLLMITMVGIGWSQPINPATGVSQCVIPFYITTSGTHYPSTNGYDNRQDGCSNWILYYSNVGFSAVSLLVESAPAAASNLPGTYVSFAGTVVTGANPSTSTTQCGIGCLTTQGYYPWIRLTATLTGSGTVVGVLMGNPTPASNIAPAPSPVISGTVDTNIKQINGSTVISGSAGLMGVAPYTWNGTTWTAAPVVCDQTAVFNLSGSGSTVVVSISGVTFTNICSISLSTTAAEDIKIVYGTGAACVTSPADLTGLYKSVQSMVVKFDPPLITGAISQAICISQSAAQATGGVISYARRL